MVGAPRRQKKSRQNADKSNSGAFILPSSDLVSKQLNSGAGKARAIYSRTLTGRAKHLSRAPRLRCRSGEPQNQNFAFAFFPFSRPPIF